MESYATPSHEKKRAEAKLPQAVPVKVQIMKGAEKIMVESGNDPKLRTYLEMYGVMVSGIADIMNQMLKDTKGKAREEQFITGVWGIINGNLQVEYGANSNDFMSEALQANKFDCTNSAYLVYDIAKKAGVGMEIVEVPRHMFVKTDNFYFETTNGEYRPLSRMGTKYPARRILKTDAEIRAFAYENKGMAHSLQHAYGEAEASYLESIRLDPKSPYAHADLGIVYNKQKRYGEALAQYRESIRLEPKNPDAYAGMGIAYYMQHEYDKAIASCNEAIRLDRRNAPVYFMLGAAHYEKADYGKAAENYLKSTKLRPDDARTYLMLGNAHYKQGKYSYAWAAYSELIDRMPENPNGYEGRANAYEKLGRKELAERDREIAERLRRKEATMAKF